MLSKRLKLLLAIGLTGALWQTPAVSISLAAEHTPDKSIVIVAIDEEALEKIDAWPWDRRVMAGILDNLGQLQPRAIGVDIIFSQPSSRPESDTLLEQSLKRQAAQTVICSMLNEWNDPGAPERPQELMLPVFSEVVPHGYCNSSEQTSLQPFVKQGDAPPEPAFALVLLKQLAPARYQQFAQAQQPFEFHLHGEPGAYRQVSASLLHELGSPRGRQRFIQALGTTPEALFKGKIVLIGATARALHDSRRLLGRDYPGVEIHAHALDCLLND